MITIVFVYENDELRYYYFQPTNESDVLCADLIAPGEILTYTREFTPGKPIETVESAADMSAE